MTTPLRKLIERAAEWNAANPVGTPVHVRMDTQCLDTTTRSEASVLGGHSAVIWLEGVSGAYDLSRVTARTDEIAAAPELLDLARRVAEHFADTDAPLGRDAVALIAKAEERLKT